MEVMHGGEKLAVYCGCSPVLDTKFEFDGDHGPIEVIVTAIAEAADVDPLSLSPLYDSIDPMVIQGFFREKDRARGSAALLSFQVEQWNVFARADGLIRICDATDSTEPEPVFDSASA